MVRYRYCKLMLTLRFLIQGINVPTVRMEHLQLKHSWISHCVMTMWVPGTVPLLQYPTHYQYISTTWPLTSAVLSSVNFPPTFYSKFQSFTMLYTMFGTAWHGPLPASSSYTGYNLKESVHAPRVGWNMPTGADVGCTEGRNLRNKGGEGRGGG